MSIAPNRTGGTKQIVILFGWASASGLLLDLLCLGMQAAFGLHRWLLDLLADRRLGSHGCVRRPWRPPVVDKLHGYALRKQHLAGFIR